VSFLGASALSPRAKGRVQVEEPGLSKLYRSDETVANRRSARDNRKAELQWMRR